MEKLKSKQNFDFEKTNFASNWWEKIHKKQNWIKNFEKKTKNKKKTYLLKTRNGNDHLKKLKKQKNLSKKLEKEIKKLTKKLKTWKKNRKNKLWWFCFGGGGHWRSRWPFWRGQENDSWWIHNPDFGLKVFNEFCLKN